MQTLAVIDNIKFNFFNTTIIWFLFNSHDSYFNGNFALICVEFLDSLRVWKLCQIKWMFVVNLFAMGSGFSWNNNHHQSFAIVWLENVLLLPDFSTLFCHKASKLLEFYPIFKHLLFPGLMKIDKAVWGWMRLNETRWDSMRLDEARWGLMRLDEARWGLMRLDEARRGSMRL